MWLPHAFKRGYGEPSPSAERVAAARVPLSSRTAVPRLQERQQAAESSAEAAVATAEGLRAAHQQVLAASTAAAQAAAAQLAAAGEQAAAQQRSLQLQCDGLEGQLAAAWSERAAAVGQAGELQQRVEVLQGGQASILGHYDAVWASQADYLAQR